MTSSYDRFPRIVVGDDAATVVVGWTAIVAALPPERIVVECYPGAPVDEVIAAFSFRPVVDTRTLFKSAADVEAMLEPFLGTDAVFARFAPLTIGDFLEPDAVSAARSVLDADTVVVGPGAAHVAGPGATLVHVAMARWELQQRQRAGRIGNLGADNRDAAAGAKYKRGYFVDWRVGDRVKDELRAAIDWMIDANAAKPRMIAGDTWRSALHAVARRPFRVVPFFDPGVWGGQWMRARFGLPDGPPNYAWCFDCVPEENSLLLGFGDATVELPALDVVAAEPQALLGADVVARFGAEFPIRFDLLDTMGGGNLSLQVHPQADFARTTFDLPYTQDESYYLLDAAPDGHVYLGLKDGVDPERFAADLRVAQAGGAPFPAEAHVNVLPARRHDHFLIPAGTVHGSGAGSMVLEISATPYIFTFKLWDWGRLGMDGKPRPIHLDHGLANIAWDRTTGFVSRELVNTTLPVGTGPGWRIERTGLHALQFIDTERVWFGAAVPLSTHGSVNVLNLVDGAAAWVESPTAAFAPFRVHYAETFIVPAGVGDYTLRPEDPAGECAVIRARVRT